MSQSFQDVLIIIVCNLIFYFKTIKYDYISDDILSYRRGAGNYTIDDFKVSKPKELFSALMKRKIIMLNPNIPQPKNHLDTMDDQGAIDFINNGVLNNKEVYKNYPDVELTKEDKNIIARMKDINLSDLMRFNRSLIDRGDSKYSPKLKSNDNALTHAFWVLEGKLKSTPEVDHAITIVLHSLVCVGIYLGFGASTISFIASLLFSFNPINNQGSVWISGRGYVLSALGMVWALALPMEMGGLMLLGATYSNAGFFMPIILLGSNHPFLILFAPLCWMFHMKSFKKNVKDKMNMEVFQEDKLIHPKKLILGVKTFGIYLSHALIPIKTTFYHSYLESIAGSRTQKAYTLCGFFWVGIISLSLTIWYMCTHQWDMICFGMLWFIIGIAPFCNLMRMQQELGERYVYAANCGLMVVLATFISPYPYLVTSFIALYATKTWFFIDGYRNDFWFIEVCRINQPESWFVWHMSAVKRWDMQSHREALIFWLEARRLSPNEFKILFNIALYLQQLAPLHAEPYRSNMLKESAEFLQEAIKNIPPGQEKIANDFIDKARKNQIGILI